MWTLNQIIKNIVRRYNQTQNVENEASIRSNGFILVFPSVRFTEHVIITNVPMSHDKVFREPV